MMYKMTKITAVASSTPHANIHHVCGHAVPLNHTEDQHEECSVTRRVHSNPDILDRVTTDNDKLCYLLIHDQNEGLALEITFITMTALTVGAGRSMPKYFQQLCDS